MRRLPAIVGGAVLAATLAACGSGDSGGGGGTALPNTSADKSTSAGQNGIDETRALTGSALAKLAQDATATAESAKARFTMTVGGEKITGEGAFKFGSGKTAVDMTMNMGGAGQMQVRMIDGAIYIKGVPGTSGSKWMKVDARLAGQVTSQADADPRKTLEMLSTVGEVKKVGSETVNGEATTRYAVTIDLAKVAAKVGGDQGKQVGVLTGQGIKTMKLDLWLNKQNLPARIITGMQMPGAGSMTQQIDYYDWGKPVSIEAPAPSEVITR